MLFRIQPHLCWLHVKLWRALPTGEWGAVPKTGATRSQSGLCMYGSVFPFGSWFVLNRVRAGAQRGQAGLWGAARNGDMVVLFGLADSAGRKAVSPVTLLTLFRRLCHPLALF